MLPRILTQIVQCRDRIAQQYLMEIIIQVPSHYPSLSSSSSTSPSFPLPLPHSFPKVFSDDFHLRTLDQLLAACLQLVEDVDVAAIVAALIQRLAKYCETNAQLIPQDLDMFKVRILNPPRLLP